MGFLSHVESNSSGKATDGSVGGTSATSSLTTWIMELLNQQPGGLTGLLSTFHDKGLGDVVNSWVGTGQNLPITAGQIQSVLEDEQVKQLAARAGVAPEVAASGVADVLPVIVDKLTPHGKVPEGGDMLEQALNLLSSRQRD